MSNGFRKKMIHKEDLYLVDHFNHGTEQLLLQPESEEKIDSTAPVKNQIFDEILIRLIRLEATLENAEKRLKHEIYNTQNRILANRHEIQKIEELWK